MIRHTRTVLWAAAIAAMGVAPSARAEGWKIPNPFSQSSSHARSSASVSDRSGWKMPTLHLPSWTRTARTSSTTRQDSMLDKVNRNTKELLGKTRDVLMPWSKPKPARSTRTDRSRTSSGGVTNWFTSWFKREQEPRKIRSVTDFLSLERPN